MRRKNLDGVGGKIFHAVFVHERKIVTTKATALRTKTNEDASHRFFKSFMYSVQFSHSKSSRKSEFRSKISVKVKNALHFIGRNIRLIGLNFTPSGRAEILSVQYIFTPRQIGLLENI